MRLPLQGIRILELGDFLPTALCCMQLSDFGAEVIRIQPPQASLQGRRAQQASAVPAETRSPFEARRLFDSCGRNRRSIVLDLKSAEGQEVGRRVAADCDVLVEGYRPGVLDRLGMGHEAVSALNPAIVYCSVSLFGQTGPYKGHPGHDPLALGVSGVLHLNSDPADNVPRLLGSLVGDISAGLHAVSGILLALRAREHDGRGQHVDISMADSSVDFSLLASIPVVQGTSVPRLNKPNPVSGVWEAADRRHLVTTNLEPHHWANFCRSIGREDLVPLRYDRSRRDELYEIVRGTMRTRTRDQWLDIFHGENESQAGPAYRIDEVFDDPHLLERGMVTDVKDAHGESDRQVGISIKLERTPGRVTRPAPVPGCDTVDIPKQLGYSMEQIQHLLDTQVVMADRESA